MNNAQYETVRAWNTSIESLLLKIYIALTQHRLTKRIPALYRKIQSPLRIKAKRTIGSNEKWIMDNGQTARAWNTLIRFLFFYFVRIRIVKNLYSPNTISFAQKEYLKYIENTSLRIKIKGTINQINWTGQYIYINGLRSHLYLKFENS